MKLLDGQGRSSSKSVLWQLEVRCLAAVPRAQALIVFSRLGVYMRLPGVDAERFAQTVQSGGILGYIDALSGGSISRVGIFSLGARFIYPPGWGSEVHA